MTDDRRDTLLRRCESLLTMHDRSKAWDDERKALLAQLREVLSVPATAHETPEQRFHEGERQSYLKAVELSVASGLLGDGDKSDLLEMYQRLWPRAPSDIRADTLKSANQTVEQMFVQCPCGCGSLIPWGPAQKANSCVCGEPNSPGTHRTDGPCLAPIGDHHP